MDWPSEMSSKPSDFIKAFRSPTSFLNQMGNPELTSVKTIESQKTILPTKSLNFVAKKHLAEKIDRENHEIMRRIMNASADVSL
jgi:hypothetical protein